MNFADNLRKQTETAIHEQVAAEKLEQKKQADAWAAARDEGIKSADQAIGNIRKQIEDAALRGKYGYEIDVGRTDSTRSPTESGFLSGKMARLKELLIAEGLNVKDVFDSGAWKYDDGVPQEFYSHYHLYVDWVKESK